MDITINLTYPINLKNISAVAIAACLWEKHDIKNKIEIYFQAQTINSGVTWCNIKDLHSRLTWESVINQVCEHAKLLQLPAILSSKVEIYITGMGYEILRWNKYLRFELDLPPEYSNKIYWTQHGSINEKKIFQLYWETLFKFDNLDNVSNHRIIILSVIFGQVKFLLKNIKIIQRISELYVAPAKGLSKDSHVHDIMAFWLAIYDQESKEKGLECFKLFKDLQLKLPVLPLLTLCQEFDLFEPFKYFFFEALKVKSENCNPICWFEAFLKYSLNKSKEDLTKTKAAEIIIFLINEMPTNVKINLVCKYFSKIVKSCMCWPFEQFIKVVINEFIDVVDTSELKEVFNFLSNCVYTQSQNETFFDKNLCWQMLLKILQKFPEEEKVKFLQGNKISKSDLTLHLKL